MRLHRGHLLAAAAACSIGIMAAPAAADVKAGVDLWMKKDYAGAVREWRPLAEKGDADAQFNLGQAYKLGRGVPTDLKIAESWYQKAAQAGHERAQSNLGLILFQGGKRTEGMPWIKKAAERDDPQAQYVYGTALFNGDLVPKDHPRAYAMMLRSAAQGLPPAAMRIGELDQNIAKEDRDKGIALAKQIEIAAAARTVPPAATAVPGAKPARIAGEAVTSMDPAPKPEKPATSAGKPAARPVKPEPVKAASAAPARTGGGWRVQLGAYGSEAAARGQWSTLKGKISGLGALGPSYEKAGAFTRLRVGPVAGRAAADKLCASAKAAGQACFPVAP